MSNGIPHEMALKLVKEVPSTEFSQLFVQGMADRMAMSFFKYGAIAEAYPHRVDAIGSLELRLKRYKMTGNTEELMDVANFAMIEFLRPRHPGASFTPQDSRDSVGRKWVGERDPSNRSNKIERLPEEW